MALLCTASQLLASLPSNPLAPSPPDYILTLSDSFPETAINSGLYLQGFKLHLSFHKATQCKMNAKYLPWQQT